MSNCHVGVHVKATDIPALTDKYNLTAAQIFTVVPQQLKLVAYDEASLARAASRLHIWIHSSYLVSPWGSAPYNHPFCTKQLKQQVAIGAQGVIFHIPKAPPRMLVAGLKRVISNKPTGARVVLENKAVRPDAFATYETPEKINTLVETFIRGGIPRKDIWLCFDTAHLYCSGVSLRTKKDAETWLKGLKYPDRIACFHLNGNSSKTFADKHTIAFGPHDRIWGGRDAIKWSDSGCAAIHEFCSARQVDIILECDFEHEQRAAMVLIEKLKNKPARNN
jgi:endonuclease IV